MKKQLVTEIVCFMFSLLFLYTGISKIIDHDSFTRQIRYSPLLNTLDIGDFWVEKTVWMLSIIEISIALLLMVNVRRKFALSLGTGMMIMFTLYIGYIVTIAPFIPCSCGGVLESLSWSQHLYFNMSFIVMGIVAILLSSTKSSSKLIDTQRR